MKEKQIKIKIEVPYIKRVPTTLIKDFFVAESSFITDYYHIHSEEDLSTLLYDIVQNEFWIEEQCPDEKLFPENENEDIRILNMEELLEEYRFLIIPKDNCCVGVVSKYCPDCGKKLI
ncbi:MAG: hypothetical protein ACOH2V_00955 [Candidatus Saccharimonadaceae bacterium]